VAEERLQVAATMQDAKDQRLVIFDAVNNDVFAHGQAAVSGTEILFARTSDARKAANRKKAVCDGVSIKRLAISILPLSFAT